MCHMHETGASVLLLFSVLFNPPFFCLSLYLELSLPFRFEKKKKSSTNYSLFHLFCAKKVVLTIKEFVKLMKVRMQFLLKWMWQPSKKHQTSLRKTPHSSNSALKSLLFLLFLFWLIAQHFHLLKHNSFFLPHLLLHLLSLCYCSS